MTTGFSARQYVKQLSTQVTKEGRERIFTTAAHVQTTEEVDGVVPSSLWARLAHELAEERLIELRRRDERRRVAASVARVGRMPFSETRNALARISAELYGAATDDALTEAQLTELSQLEDALDQLKAK